MEIFKLYKGTISIGFEEREWNGNKVHKYTKENGDIPLSVTKVTGTVDKSPFLIPWAIRLMGEYLLEKENGKIITPEIVEEAKKKWREAKEEAADIGSAAHDWIEQHIKGKNPAMPENEKVLNCVNAYLKWEKENKIKWVVNEGLVYSKKYDFVGKLDAIAKINGKTYLIDYKSSKGIYEEFYLQTAGYQLAYEEEHGKCIDGRILLHLGKEDGAFEHREILDYEKDKKGFIGLLATKKRLEELKKSK
jgi:CRISPR/Cas system-associated exonuclease Cas4 (RecB family)